MLLLSRRVGESILIGRDVRVTVIELRGGFVRLGIDCPQGVKILRSELATARGGDANDGSEVSAPRAWRPSRNR